MQKLLLSEQEVSELTGISIPKLRSDRYNKQGLPYKKIGRLVKYSYQDILSYVNSLPDNVRDVNNV